MPGSLPNPGRAASRLAEHPTDDVSRYHGWSGISPPKGAPPAVVRPALAGRP